MSIGRQSALVAIKLICNAWDQLSMSTILYFAIVLLVLLNLWMLVLVGQHEEAGRGKEMRRKEEREKWMHVTGPWDERVYVHLCTKISSGTSHGLLTNDCLLLLSG